MGISSPLALVQELQRSHVACVLQRLEAISMAAKNTAPVSGGGV